MLLTIFLLLLGLALLVWGSDILVDGSSDIARRSGLSEFVIGLTIVGIGTSTPEMVVSWISSIHGNSDIAIGNVIGSNIFNTLLILGLTSIILPLEITKDNIRKDIPINIFVTVLLVLTGMSYSIFSIGTDSLSRPVGALFILLFALYMYISFKGDRKGDAVAAENDGNVKIKPLWLSIVMVVVGLVALIGGGEMLIENAVELARAIGCSDKFIAITILAGGTSLPELATCVVAALKKKGQMALGNILGSNISNILLILGGSALIRPVAMSNITPVDIGFLVLASLFILCSYFTCEKRRLDRSEGCAMVLMEAVYMYLLISNL